MDSNYEYELNLNKKTIKSDSDSTITQDLEQAAEQSLEQTSIISYCSNIGYFLILFIVTAYIIIYPISMLVLEIIKMRLIVCKYWYISICSGIVVYIICWCIFSAMFERKYGETNPLINCTMCLIGVGILIMFALFFITVIGASMECSRFTSCNKLNHKFNYNINCLDTSSDRFDKLDNCFKYKNLYNVTIDCINSSDDCLKLLNENTSFHFANKTFNC